MQPETPSPDARQQFMGRLAAGVAHEVANRLAVARLIADSMTTRTDLPADVVAKLHTLAASVDEAGELMEQLSAVSGRRRAPAHIVHLESVIAAMSPLFVAALGGRALEVAGTGIAFVDRAEVEAALLRLVLGQRRGRGQPPLEIAIVPGDDAVGVAVAGEVLYFPSRRRGVILVVEDDRHLRELVRDALAADDHEVVTAGDADQGAKVLADGGVQLLVTDVELHGASGLDLAARVVADGLPVLLMSGHSAASMTDDIPVGAFVIEKPFGVPQLRADVQRALASAD